MLGRQTNRLLPWAVGVGAAAGAGAAAYTIVRLVRRRWRPPPMDLLQALEEAAVELLRRDRTTRVCAIEVAALGPGILELSGTVPTQEVGQRAARMLHALRGVRTVVNRLDAGALEGHLADNRRRRAAGDAPLAERQWFGVRVGTGRRRQSTATEPDRPDDTVERRTKELDIDETELADATSPEADEEHGRIG